MAAEASHSQAQTRDEDLLDAGCDYAAAPFSGKGKAKAFPAVPIPANQTSSTHLVRHSHIFHSTPRDTGWRRLACWGPCSGGELSRPLPRRNTYLMKGPLDSVRVDDWTSCSTKYPPPRFISQNRGFLHGRGRGCSKGCTGEKTGRSRTSPIKQIR